MKVQVAILLLSILFTSAVGKMCYNCQYTNSPAGDKVSELLTTMFEAVSADIDINTLPRSDMCRDSDEGEEIMALKGNKYRTKCDNGACHKMKILRDDIEWVARGCFKNVPIQDDTCEEQENSGTKSFVCMCKGNLCNGAGTIGVSFFSLILVFLALFTSM